MPSDSPYFIACRTLNPNRSSSSLRLQTPLKPVQERSQSALKQIHNKTFRTEYRIEEMSSGIQSQSKQGTLEIPRRKHQVRTADSVVIMCIRGKSTKKDTDNNRIPAKPSFTEVLIPRNKKKNSSRQSQHDANKYNNQVVLSQLFCIT